MKKNKEVQEALWSDLEHEKLFPQCRPLLAHYTSIATFESILSNEEFWFSHPLTMNDYEELVFGMNQGATIFRSHQGIREACKDDKSHRSLIYYFDELLNMYDVHHAADTYILCFSDHSDQGDDGALSMWRGYGQNGNGIAVVIDTQKIKPLKGSPLIVAPVEYATQEERRAWIDKKLTQLAEFIRQDDLDNETLKLYAYFWLKRLISFSLFTKHCGFREEQEWRIVYMRDADPMNSLEEMLGYHATDEGLQPKLKLKLNQIPSAVGEKIDIEDLVHKIILGPTTSSVLARNALARMVRNRGKPKLSDKIVYSSIPFRHKR